MHSIKEFARIAIIYQPTSNCEQNYSPVSTNATICTTRFFRKIYSSMHLFLPFSQVKWPKTYLNSIYPVQPNNLLETLHIFAGPSKYHPPMSPKKLRTETESRELHIRGKNQKYMATPKKIEQFNQKDYINPNEY